MDTMPDSVLLHIFSGLNRETLCLGVRMTCCRWRQLSHDPSLWRYVTIPDHLTDSRLFCLLSQIQDCVEELEMSNCNCVTSEGFVRLATDLRFPRLRRLSVPIQTTLPDHVYELLSAACPALEETENIRSAYGHQCNPLTCQRHLPQLRVVHDRPVSSYGRIRKGAVDDGKRRRWLTDLQNLAADCVHVTRYCCNRGMEYLNADTIQVLAEVFPRLKAFELRNCTLDDRAMELFFTAARRSHGGDGLDIRDIVLDKPGPLSDCALKAIADSCPQLESIKISRCSQITNWGVQYLVRHCKQLKDLHINNAVGCFEGTDTNKDKEDMTDETVAVVADNLPHLYFFRLFYSRSLSTVGLTSLLSGCRFLHGVMLFECCHLDDSAVAVLWQLSFLKAAILVDCDRISPAGLVQFVLRAPSLVRLTFYTNNDQFYGDMSALCRRTYDLIDGGSVPFTPSVVNKLALRGVGGGFLQLITVLCPGLLCLDLRGSCYVGTASLTSVLKNCEALEDLDVGSVDRSDDGLLRACCVHGDNLRSLSLGGAVRYMSTAALCDVIRTCRSLRVVTMDAKGADVDERALLEAARRYHGGHCFLFEDTDDFMSSEDDPKQRYIEFHFTPIKYLASINTTATAKQTYVT